MSEHILAKGSHEEEGGGAEEGVDSFIGKEGGEEECVCPES